MYDIIPLVIIFLSLLTIIIILVRKFPVLASLDLSTIQSEKEAQFKEQIIGKRLKRNIIRYSSKIARFFRPIFAWVAELWANIHKKLVDFKENYNKHESPVVLSGDLSEALAQADSLMKEESYEEAEKKYIEIISQDSQNLDAFKGLGKLYAEKKQYNEAKQTFEHVLRLLEHDEASAGFEGAEKGQNRSDAGYLSSIYFELALLCKNNDDFKCAQENIVRASDIEPNNPRYLDMKLEISIMNKDKIVALDALKKLIEVNPENNKIREFEERIRGI